MKKMFFLYVVMLMCMNVSSFGQTRIDEITVDGFDGNKPLKENTVVIVDYPEKWMKGIWEDAYKGETRQSFLERIEKRSEESKESYSVKKSHDKEEDVLLIHPVDYQATYHKPYASNVPKPKREYLTLQEFSDSIMMSENNREEKIDTSSVGIASDTEKNQAMTQSRAQMIILFIVCLVLVFFLFSKIPLLWSKKK